MKGKRRSILVIAGLCLTILLPLLLAGTVQRVSAKDDIDVSATLSTTSFSLSSGALLRITVIGAQSADIELPEVDNITFHRRGQSTQVQMVNGSFSSSITYTYGIEALQEGTYSLPPVKAVIKGEEYSTREIAFTVTAAADSSRRNRQQADGSAKGTGGDLAFITVSGMKEKSYLGQIMPVEIKAYFRSGIRAEIKKLPEIQGDGFVMAPLSNDPEQTIDSHNGRPYSVITWSAALSPIREGTFDLLLDLDATLDLPQQNRSRRPRDPFFDDDLFSDDIFDRFFGRTIREQVTLTTEPQTVTVLPLPEEGRPQEFSGAVGSFDFSVTAKPSEVHIGEPVTLTMTVSGKGNFDRVAVPPFPDNGDWKTYSPSAKFAEQGTSYTGKKTFERAIVPKNGGISEVPALQFSYFDPEEEVYVTLSTDPLPISVKGNPPASPPHQAETPVPKTPRQTAEAPNSDELPAVQMRLSPGTFVQTITPVFRQNWFVAATILVSFLLVGTLSIFLVKKHRARDSSQLALKRSEKEIVGRLAALEESIGNGDAHTFLHQCRSLIQHRLALSWNMEPGAITGMDLRQRLGDDSPLTVLFMKAEQQAYGGSQLSREEMASGLDMLKTELKRVS